MAKLTQAQVKEMAKANVLKTFEDVIRSNEEAVILGNVAYIPTEVEDKTIWVEVKLTSKNWYDTATTTAFDIGETIEEYETEQEIRRKRDEEREAKKKAKLAKQAERKKKKEEEEE